MKLSNLLFCLLPLAFAPAFVATDAQACGGCIVSQTQQTEVTGHRMILSISKDSTTLWDQITYSGEPNDFAWVLPIKGTVEVGLSSDALFSSLEQATAVTINSPTINCLPPDCQFGPPNSGGNSSGSGGAGGGGVVVLAEEVVGPYATVQLSSQDPNALKTWLANNGYNLPADIVPIVNAYVAENFNFLALKLAPGQGINSMRPVRVTTPGATPVLPLRMVAAGTGLNTPITLWVMGEGRYEPANFGNFVIDQSKLTWDWDKSSSDYAVIKQAAFDASGGKSWLIEAAEPFTKSGFEASMLWSAMNDPVASGYGLDPKGPTAVDECTADLDKLFAGIPDATMWVTRMNAVLSRPALSNDLNLQASADQSFVNRWLQVTNSIGTPPACPPPPEWCYGSSSSSSSSSSSGNPWDPFPGPSPSSPSASCAMGSESGASASVGLLATALAMSLTRRRSRKTRSTRSS